MRSAFNFRYHSIAQLLLAFFTSLLLLACSQAPEADNQQQVIQAVKLAKVATGSEQLKRNFPAEVSAVKTIDLSFEVSGRLIQTQLLTGTTVKKGQVLASIDPVPFKQRLQEAEARLGQANRDLRRIEATAKNGLVSQSQLDTAKTNQELAQIALDRAKQDLSYTKLMAPFNAQIAERLAENGSYVQTGDIIAKLQDISRFYFNVNVPERLVSRYKQGSLVTAQAHIISSPDKTYQLEYVEHDTQPDPITQTYKVVFAATAEDSSLTPGARAIVSVSLSNPEKTNALLVPFTAIQGNDAEGFHLWKYDANTSQVSRVQVNVQRIEGELAAISSGVAEGDLVVAAGAAKMREGLQVKPYQGRL